jgi:hypothetical protein
MAGSIMMTGLNATKIKPFRHKDSQRVRNIYCRISNQDLGNVTKIEIVVA